MYKKHLYFNSVFKNSLNSQFVKQKCKNRKIWRPFFFLKNWFKRLAGFTSYILTHEQFSLKKLKTCSVGWTALIWRICRCSAQLLEIVGGRLTQLINVVCFMMSAPRCEWLILILVDRIFYSALCYL